MTVEGIEHVVVGATALVATLVATPLVRLLGSRLGVVARSGDRHVHAGAVPRIGGVAIFAGFATALALRVLGESVWGWEPALTRADLPVAGLFAGLSLMFVVGLLDDFLDLKPGVKFGGQLAAASVACMAGVRIAFVGDPIGGGIVMLGVLAVPVTLAWMVGFANVINLIDGLDGLAAGVSAIAAGSLLVLALQSNQALAAVLATVVIGACLGFLRFNFNPASVFMGDSGALLLGLSLACISLLGVMKSVAAITLVVPLLIVWVPIFDTASAIIRRRRHGRPIQEADRGHIHHRLLGRGFTQRQTVLIIYVWSIALAFGGYAMRWVPLLYKGLTFVVLAVVSGFMAHWLGLFEAAHDDE